jgi:pimeloyl-ACP methyl ester carboxylesterase
MSMMMSTSIRKWLQLWLILICSIGLAVSCGQAAPSNTNTTATLPPTATILAQTASVRPTSVTGPFSKPVDIGGRRLFLQCQGNGPQTVILESGLISSSTDWAVLIPRLTPSARVCIYDRANAGLSDAAPTPRTAQDIAHDLHALLYNAGIAGPYLLVGWSVGGMYSLRYAATYPEDLIGLILIDPAHPEQTQRELALLPPESSSESRGMQQLRKQLQTDPLQFRENQQEQIDIRTSEQQVRAITTLGAMPLIVFTAGRLENQSGIPATHTQAMQQEWLSMHRHYLSLSTNSQHIIAERSYHCIQCMQPDLVVNAIQSLLQTGR